MVPDCGGSSFSLVSMEKYEKAPIEEAIEDVEAFLVFMADWPPDIGCWLPDTLLMAWAYFSSWLQLSYLSIV